MNPVLGLLVLLAADPDFTRDILPIFENYCLGCHTTGMRMGSFECDTYEGVMRGATHGAVVVPGKSAESRLYLTLTGKITPAMPMNNRTLTKSELETIRLWIDSGAKPPLKKGKAMKLGINTLLWTAGFNETHLPLFPRIKAWGFDGVEVATFSFDDFPAKTIASAARDAGLECTLCSALTGSLSLIGDKPTPARDFLKRGIDAAAEMGSSVFVGPFCAPVGQLLGRRRTTDEWEQAIEELFVLVPHLESHKVTMAVEPLNRFETYFLNTIADGVDLCKQIGSNRIRLLYDTFHANIEEKDPAASFTAAASHIAHVHTCENDRGIPGSGHVDWVRLFGAMHKAQYNDWLVIESFGFSIPEIAAAACIWRDLATNAEDIASEGVQFLKRWL